MATKNVPLASLEVRWFFQGAVDQHQVLKKWFETAKRKDGLGPPEWKGRLQDKPDVYLLVPASDDMGIKWREGDFQIKGRVASLGTQVFCNEFQGKVERWMKWSYATLPEPYQRIFADGKQNGLSTIAVSKRRALRKVRLNTLTGEAEEVDAKTFIDRGFGFELTDLKVGEKAHCSVAFEAFPDDSAMDAAFTQAVEAFLADLKGVNLSATNSLSYPAWLREVHRAITAIEE
jgi:hypothetical protein